MHDELRQTKQTNSTDFKQFCLVPPQAELGACDRAGGRDAGVPVTELLEDWVQIVAACDSAGEVEGVVRPLLASL